jgi:hypothetical protein
MSATLSNDDRCAVDLLLEHAQSTSAPCFTQAPTQELQERLSRVEGLLNILNSFQASEPPGDLMARTVSRCMDGADFKAGPGSQPAVSARP